MYDEYYRVLGVHPGVGPDELRAAYRAAMRRVHPDLGGSDDQAKLVNEAYRALSQLVGSEPRAGRAGAGGPRRRCPWCDAAVADEWWDRHSEEHLADDITGRCERCGRPPAGSVTFRSVRGRVLWHRVEVDDLRLCSVCATGAYRRAQEINVLAGPWAVLSGPLALWFGLTNALSYRNLTKRLQPPRPARPGTDDETIGPPVFQRLRVQVSALAMLVLTLSVIVWGALGFPGLESGGVPLAARWELGACVRLDAGSALEVPCDGTETHRVVAIVADSDDCPSRAVGSVARRDGSFACLA